MAKAPAKKTAAKKKAPAKKTAAKKVVVKKSDPIKTDEGGILLKITVNEQVYEFDTAHVADTLLALPEQLSSYIKTRMIVSATYGEKTVDKVYNVAFAKRLLTNRIAADVFEKATRLALAFDVS